MRFLPGNAQHIGARHSQQDSFGFSDPGDDHFMAHGGFVAIVCDGMGGMEFGDEASRLAVRAFLEAYARKTEDETIPDALERSVREANAQVVELAKGLGMKDGVGTTLVAAALYERSLYYISVGDSGLFLSAPGEYRMLNRPHVFANVLDAAVARGTMSREDAQAHPERESLTSYIGTEKLEEIDQNLEPYPLHDGDTVLLASDGMFKTLSPEEIRACLAGDPQRWPEILVSQTIAHHREYQDNVTVLSVTPSDALSPTLSPRREAPAPAPALASKPAVEWPSGEFAAVPTPPPRSSPWWLLLVAVVIVAAGVAGWWYVTHVRPAAATAPSDPEKGIDVPALRREPPAPSPAEGAPAAAPANPPGANPDGAPPATADPREVPAQSAPALPPPLSQPQTPASSKTRKP
jgi:PPM family protein phosphatase